MIKLLVLIFTILTLSATTAAQGHSWVIQLEEPTGIERRDNEVVRILARFAPGEVRLSFLRLLNDKNIELPIQVIAHESHPDGSIRVAELLFPATLLPGQLPR